MAKRLRLSLANKCQILFGAAVVIILVAALAVVWVRMTSLVERGPEKRARDFADAWMADLIHLGGALAPIDAIPMTLAPDQELVLSLIDASQFDEAEAASPFLAGAIERFESDREAGERFASAEDADGQTYYRYARAIRKSDLARIRSGAAAGFDASLDVTGLADPVEKVLVIDLRDRDADIQQLLNRIYLVAAGLVAGLLAIAVFWFITTRIILSPVRLLRDYAGRVSEGNLNIRSDINTGDEFEQLSNMFNNMLDRVRHNEQELRSINKSLDLKLGELAESNVALYEANKIKGDFLANVSHELRTPLNSIVGFAEVLQETLIDRTGPIDEKRKRYIANIISSSRRLLELINDLLDLAKIEAGRMELRLAKTNVGDLCEGLVNLMKPQAEPLEIALKLKAEPNLPLANTDAGKLQQILFNFLSNAVKFTPHGGSVTLAAVAIPPAKPDQSVMIRISVSDTGPGIPAAEHPRIFEKFIQLDLGVTKQHGGTGLGLTISKELADMLHGRIELDSAPGHGATFSLFIPVEPPTRSAPLMPDLVETPPTAAEN